MKFTTAIVAVLATVAAASPFVAHNGTNKDMPKCAYECLEKLFRETTNCKEEDYKCMCDKKVNAQVMKKAPKCILKACDMAKALTVNKAAEAEAEALAKNSTIAQNTTIHARAFLARNTTVHGMVLIPHNSTANKTLLSA
ncbi:hypothetical protein BM221_009511 [Beauveria bassiana]|uniref:CFEM domain-containing protein n=1 Tax=Beauveria bassiana TaxID=176275 RepID=A0A2N6NBM2_BEABA|nr:hypothetical protein BM221_009511 [Beauveria bassiana]